MEIYFIKCGIVLLVGYALWKIGGVIWEADERSKESNNDEPRDKGDLG